MQCEYYALEGIARLLHTYGLVRRRLNPRIKILGVLLTMYDERTNLSAQVIDDVRKHFHGSVFESVVPRNVRLAEAPSLGQPILLYDIRSKGAEAYLSLTKEILRHETQSAR